MIPEDNRAKRIRELFREWADARKDWETAAREDIDFYLGNHFSASELDTLSERNQTSVAIDRLYSAIEQFKAIITSKPPKFSAVGREDSDNRLANVWKVILEYVWDLSNGDEEFKQAVHDYAVTGLGYLYTYLDKEADYGRGEIKFKSVNPFRVAVDPNARHRYFDDASGIAVSTVFSKFQLIDLYPQLKEIPEDSEKPLIELIETMDADEDYPSATNSQTMQSFTPDVVKDYDRNSQEKYRLIEFYSKVKVPYYRVINLQTQQEQILDSDKFQQFMANPQIQPMVQQGMIDYAEVMQTRIKLTCTLGQIVLYERVLETDLYPIVPLPNIWTNTPYPMSDVRKNKDFQRYLNKCMSLITTHAQASAGLKLLVPQGSVQDIEELERDWANPNATIEYDSSFGEPHFPSPQPMSNSLMTLPTMIEKYIDLNMGIFEMQQGNSEVAPRTSSATMMLEDFGQRRSKSKLRDIEGGLKRLGQVVYYLAKDHYDFQKTFRICQPNNDMTEFTINKKVYDDKTKELSTIENDLAVDKFDIKVIGNSTMPTNKWGEWNIYMEAFQAGLIDKTEALKKTEIFDKEGVLMRMDEVGKLQGMLQQAQQQIEELSGDLQTAHREAISARKRTEVEKFKTKLKDTELSAKYDNKLSSSRIKDAVKLESEKLKIETKKSQLSSKK